MLKCTRGDLDCLSKYDLTRMSWPPAHTKPQVEKLFDIAYVLVDVIALLPPEPATFAASPRDHLGHFLTLITLLRRGETRFVALLRNKIRETLPDQAAALGLPPNEPTPTGSAHPGQSPVDHSRSSSYGPPEPLLPPPLRRLDSSHSSSASVSSYGGMAGLSPIAPATPRYSGRGPMPGATGGLRSSADAGGSTGLGMGAASDAMDTDPPPKPYGMPYGLGSGYRPP